MARCNSGIKSGAKRNNGGYSFPRVFCRYNSRMNIQDALLTKNIFSRPGKKLESVKGIVIHWVANPGSSAMANRNYFESLKSQSLNDAEARYASAHFVVGIGGEVVQCLPTDEAAYHVGAKKYTPEAVGAFGHFPNSRTVGIELCHPGADGSFTPETLGAARAVCALLCAQSGLCPLQDIWTHHQITRKDCPKWFVVHPEAFEEFKHCVAESVRRLKG